MGFFHQSWDDAKKKGDRDREEKVLTPYLNCILKSPRPNIALAKQLADRAVSIKKSKWSLWRQAETYLMRWNHFTGDDDEEVKLDYFDVMDELERYPGGKPFYNQIMAQECEINDDWDAAVAYMDQANPDNGLGVTLKKWGLMLRSQRGDLIDRAVSEIQNLCASKARQQAKRVFSEAIADLYAKALSNKGQLQKFKLKHLGLPLTEAKLEEIYLNARNSGGRSWEIDD
ncbi:MAG: hypothetical protein KDE15_04815 [Erythrobacter sp.]|nr:hypothetical protein [Erythrobacter sp.]